jgi:hypothetical protein
LSAADVNIAVIRIPNEAMLTPFEFAIEFVEYDLRQERRKHAPYTKGNFQFERTVKGWRTRYPVLDLRLKR